MREGQVPSQRRELSRPEASLPRLLRYATDPALSQQEKPTLVSDRIGLCTADTRGRRLDACDRECAEATTMHLRREVIFRRIHTDIPERARGNVVPEAEPTRPADGVRTKGFSTYWHHPSIVLRGAASTQAARPSRSFVHGGVSPTATFEEFESMKPPRTSLACGNAACIEAANSPEDLAFPATRSNVSGSSRVNCSAAGLWGSPGN